MFLGIDPFSCRLFRTHHRYHMYRMYRMYRLSLLLAMLPEANISSAFACWNNTDDVRPGSCTIHPVVIYANVFPLLLCLFFLVIEMILLLRAGLYSLCLPYLSGVLACTRPSTSSPFPNRRHLRQVDHCLNVPDRTRQSTGTPGSEYSSLPDLVRDIRRGVDSPVLCFCLVSVPSYQEELDCDPPR